MDTPAYRRASLELQLADRRRELASVTGQPLAQVEAACAAIGQPMAADLDCAWRRLMEAPPSPL